MKLDWEGEIEIDGQIFYIHARYSLELDDEGFNRIPYIQDVEAFDEDGCAVNVDPSVYDIVADYIDAEEVL